MIDNTPSPTPEEASLARQAALNARKEEQRATISPEEQARLDVIESVSRQLEAAQIPFLLFADSVSLDESTKRSCWWQFNKMGYESVWTEMVSNAQDRMRALLQTTVAHMSRTVTGYLVWMPEGNKPPVGGATKGEWSWYKPREEKE